MAELPRQSYSARLAAWWRRQRAEQRRRRVAMWHRQGRCWTCGAYDHYGEGCPRG